MLVYHFQSSIASSDLREYLTQQWGETPQPMPSHASFFLHMCALVLELGHVQVPHSDSALSLRNPVPLLLHFYTMKKKKGNSVDIELQFKDNWGDMLMCICFRLTSYSCHVLIRLFYIKWEGKPLFRDSCIFLCVLESITSYSHIAWRILCITFQVSNDIGSSLDKWTIQGWL